MNSPLSGEGTICMLIMSKTISLVKIFPLSAGSVLGGYIYLHVRSSPAVSNCVFRGLEKLQCLYFDHASHIVLHMDGHFSLSSLTALLKGINGRLFTCRKIPWNVNKAV